MSKSSSYWQQVASKEELVQENEQDFQDSPMLEQDNECKRLNMSSTTMAMALEPLKLMQTKV